MCLGVANISLSQLDLEPYVDAPFVFNCDVSRGSRDAWARAKAQGRDAPRLICSIKLLAEEEVELNTALVL